MDALVLKILFLFSLSYLNSCTILFANRNRLHELTVWYSSFGQMDMKGFAQSLTKKDLNRVNAYTLEKMMQAIREENNNQGGRATISRQVIVYDMEGLALKQITNKAGKYCKLQPRYTPIKYQICLIKKY